MIDEGVEPHILSLTCGIKKKKQGGRKAERGRRKTEVKKKKNVGRYSPYQ